MSNGTRAPRQREAPQEEQRSSASLHPLVGTVLVAGLAALAFTYTHNALAIVAIAALAGVAFLMSDYRR
jgi:hypothetical protein